MAEAATPSSSDSEPRTEIDMGVIWRLLCVLVLLAVATGCTVLRVESDPDEASVRARGLVRGHATFGFSDEERIANLRLLGGSNRGAVAEVVIWKLLRVEAGLAGLSVGIGPLHLGLGTLFYDPRPPSLHEAEECEAEDCEEGEGESGEEEWPETAVGRGAGAGAAPIVG